MSSIRTAKPLGARERDDGVPRDRKAEHIQLALEPGMQFRRNFFEDWVFEHDALPEIDYDEIETQTSFLGRRLSAPLLISCMTGGTEEAMRINRNLAHAAEATGVAFGVGSQRKALEDPSVIASFAVRPFAPSIPLLANLGAVQLNYGYGVEECRKAVEMIDADALVLHVNALQEAIQPEGQRNFSGLLPKIAEVVSELDVPVIVKEVGCGISRRVAERLVRLGVGIVDTAGMGGTNWARIEAARASDRAIGELFADWGIPSPLAIRRLREIPGLTVIGSGGLRSGVDCAKAVAAGADIAGLAYPFLQAAAESTERAIEMVRHTVEELKICMFCVGARNIEELGQTPLLPAGGHRES